MTERSSVCQWPHIASLPTINLLFIIMTKTMIPIKRDSMSHVALQYLKMKSCSITVDQLRKFSPHKYKAPYKAKQALDLLYSLGFAQRTQDCYAITDEGIQALHLIVKQQKKKTYTE